ILLPYVMEYNYISSPEKYLKIARIFYPNRNDLTILNAGELVVQYVEKLSQDIGAPQRLSDFGLTEKDADIISRYAIEDACMITNPRDLTKEDVKTLFIRAL